MTQVPKRVQVPEVIKCSGSLSIQVHKCLKCPSDFQESKFSSSLSAQSPLAPKCFKCFNTLRL